MQKEAAWSTVNHDLVALLYQKHAHVLFKYIFTNLARREEAEDLLVEVFLAALRDQRLEHLNEKQQFAWLFAVARNKIADWYRAGKHLPHTSLEQILPASEAHVGQEPSLEATFVRHEEYALLRKQIAQLPEQQQEVLQLRFIMELPHSRIAELLGKTEGAIHSLLWRAIRSLRTLYQHDTTGREDL